MDMMKAVFRNAVKDDLASIMQIESEAFHQVICESEMVFAERIRVFPEGFRLMEYEGRVIGYICSELWNKKENLTPEAFVLGHAITESHVPAGKTLYISSMGILSEYRGQGFGKLMFSEFLKYAEEALPQVELMLLVVSDKWATARKIYYKSGFKESFTMKKFFCYKAEKVLYEDGIVMRRKIEKIVPEEDD